MAIRRYKAGTIFLDVAPSFDGVQDKIRGFVKKKVNPDLERAAKRDGEKYGEAFAEGLEKTQGKAEREAAESRTKLNKKVNDAVISDARRTERAIQQIRAKAADETEKQFEARRKREEAAIRRYERERNAAYREEAKRRQALADEMADAREKAERARYEREVARAAALEAEKDKARAAELEHWERIAAQEKGNDARANERSGGRIGRLIRKAVGNAMEDLPDVEINADTGPANRAIAEIQARLLKLRSANIGVDLSAGDARKEIAEITAELSAIARHHDGSIRINALAAMSSLKAVDDSIDKIQRKVRRPLILRIVSKVVGERAVGLSGLGEGPRGGKITDDGANAFRAFNPLILAAVTSLSMLGPATAVAAAGLVTIAGAAVAAGAGLGVLALAFQGVFQAVQDQIKAEDDLTKNGAQQARQREQAARQVRDAKERLADAEVNAARATEDAARRVADAEERLADARAQAADDIARALETQQAAEERVQDSMDAAANAQRNLNEARQEAKRDIEDLALAYRGAKLDEQEARLGIIQAQERLSSVRNRAYRGEASWTDVRDAELGVSQARLRAEESTVKRQRAGADSSAASKKGVKGHERVRDAEDRLQDALASQASAQRSLEKATKDVSRTRVQAARNVRDAEQAVTDALRQQSRTVEDNARMLRDARQGVADANQAAADAMENTSAAAKNAQQSMADLSPAGRRFALFILSLRGGYKELRDLAAAGVLPGLEEGMRQLGVYGAGFRKFVSDMGKMWGDTFRDMGKQLTGPTWKSFFATMGKDGPRQARLFNTAMMNILTTIAALIDAFSPLTTEMLEWFAEATKGWAEWAAGLKGSPGFERFLEYVRRVAPEIKDFFIQLGKTAIAIGVALAPFGEALINIFTRAFEAISGMDPKTLELLATAFVSLFIAMQLGNGAIALMTSLLVPFKSPLSLLVMLLVAAAAAVIYFYQTNDTFREKVDRVIERLKEFGAILWRHRDTVLKVATAIGALFVLNKFFHMLKAGQAILALFGKSMSAAFLLNPWVLGITALVAAIVYLWKTNESFREAMKAVWEAVKSAVAAVVAWFTETALPALGKAFDWFKREILPGIVAVLKDIGAVVTWLWENIVSPGLKAWAKIFGVVFTAIKFLWETVLWPVLKLIGAVFKLMWAIVKPIIQALWWVVKLAFQIIAAYWKNILWPVLRAIGKAFMEHVGKPAKNSWDKYLKPVFEWIKKGINKVGESISKAADWISEKWKKIEKGMTDPLRSVIKWINKYFISKVNSLLGKIGISWRIPLISLGNSEGKSPVRRQMGRGADGSNVPRFASGGRIYDPLGDSRRDGVLGISPTTGMPTAWVDHDEMVINKHSTRRLDRKHPGLLSYLNHFGDLPKHAIGGKTRGLNKDFLEALAQFNRAAGGRFSVYSGLRTYAEQAALYRRYLNGGNLAARPGTSNHESGNAADLAPSNARDTHGALAAKFGLHFPVPSEAWHIELKNGSKMKAVAGWIARALSKPAQWAKEKVTSLLSKIPGQGTLSAELARGTFSKFSTAIGDKIKEFSEMSGEDGGAGSGNFKGGNVERWRPTVLKALSMLGQPDSLANTTLRRMNQESAGNPRAINNWDSNARNGDPSKGLMQVIGCVPLDTKILTQRGWLAHDEVREGDLTIGFNHDTGRSEWTRVTGVVHYDDAEVWRIGNGQWQADVTPEHRWVTETDRVTRTGFSRTDELRWESLRVAAPAETPVILPITDDEAAILGWVHGDGHLREAFGSTGQHRGWDAQIYQSKPAGVEAIDALLAGVPHTRSARKPRESDSWPSYVWRLRRAFVTDLVDRAQLMEQRSLEEWVAMLSTTQRAAWLDAMIRAEGHAADGFTRISQVDGPVQDAITLAVYLEGYRPTFSAMAAERNGYKPSGHVGMARPRVAASAMKEPEVLERQPVWCVETELGSWTMRQGRRVTLTGNSTFRRYAMPGFDRNIYDPLSNILASMRYTLARYGSLPAGYNLKGGYAAGTDSATPGWHLVGEEGPEYVRFRGGEQVYNRQQTMRLAQLAAERDSGGMAVYVQNPWTGEYLLSRVERVVSDNDAFKASIGRMNR